MRVVEYAFRHGWIGLTRERAAAGLAILAIALAMVVLGGVILVTSNLQRQVARWSEAAELSIYLRDDATSEQRGAVERLLDHSGAISAHEYVSRGQALARFRREFTQLAPETTGTMDNPFPASIEARVRPDAGSTGPIIDVARRAATLPGVADVRLDREWIARVDAVVRAIRRIGLGLVLIMALAAASTVAAVVRLGLQARRDEIDLMTLVGSPLAYIRGPFIAEGVLQGGIGAILALVLLWLAFAGAIALWGDVLAVALDGEALRFLSVPMSVTLVLGGLVVGGLGGLTAARHAG